MTDHALERHRAIRPLRWRRATNRRRLLPDRRLPRHHVLPSLLCDPRDRRRTVPARLLPDALQRPSGSSGQIGAADALVRLASDNSGAAIRVRAADRSGDRSLIGRIRRLKHRGRVPIGRGEPRERFRTQDFHPSFARQPEKAAVPEEREGPAHRLDCQAEIVRNVLPLHREIEHPGAQTGGTGCEHGQEPGQTLLRRTASDHHHVVDGKGQRPGRAVEERRVEARVVVHANTAGLPGQDRHCGGVDSLDRQFVRFVGLEPADVARHVKREHLSAPVAGELHRAEHAAHDEIEVLRRVAFAHHLLPALERNDQRV